MANKAETEDAPERTVARMKTTPRSFALTLFLVAAAACGSRAEQGPVAPIATGTSPTAGVAAESFGTFTSDGAGFDTHSYWLDTGREVVVFDAQFTPALAEKLVAEIRAKTKSPIRFVVVTHPNPDKFNGAPVFQALGAKVVASERTAAALGAVHAYKKHYFVNVAKMFTASTYPAEPRVDVTFRGDLELPLEGGAVVKLHELANAGVSSTQTVAFIPSRRALVVGDLVHHKSHAWLEGGIVDGRAKLDIAGWKRALEELRTYEGATVYGGRGEPAPVAEAVDAEIAYLDRMHAIVTGYVKDLGPAKGELFGPKAGEHHKKIHALAAKAFPDYTLGYLVEHGAYGLVNQVAAEQ